MTQQAEKKTTLRPLGNRVLAKRLDPEETMKGGIILPDTAKKKQERAIVIAVGPGKYLEEGKVLPILLEPGDVILMEKYAVQEVEIDGIEHVIVKAEDVIAVIEQ